MGKHPDFDCIHGRVVMVARIVPSSNKQQSGDENPNPEFDTVFFFTCPFVHLTIYKTPVDGRCCREFHAGRSRRIRSLFLVKLLIKISYGGLLSLFLLLDKKKEKKRENQRTRLLLAVVVFLGLLLSIVELLTEMFLLPEQVASA